MSDNGSSKGNIREFRIADDLLRKMAYIIGGMIIFAFGVYIISFLKSGLLIVFNVLAPFIIGLLLAYVFSPIVVFLQEKLKLGRIMGTLVLYCLFGLAFLIIMAIIIPTFISELVKLFKAVKIALPGFLDMIAANKYIKIDAAVIESWQTAIMQAEPDYSKVAKTLLPGLENTANYGIQTVEAATRGVVSGLNAAFGLGSFFTFVVIITFYMVVDWEKIGPMVKKVIPPKFRERFFDVLDKVDEAMGGFLRGQLTVAIIVGVLFAVGLFFMSFMGFPALRNYCILIGTAAAIGGFIPYLGALIGVTPAILIVLLTGGGIPWNVKITSLIGVLLIFGGIQAIEGVVLQPRIVGKSAGLHPLVVMLSLIAGAQFGIGGMIVAVPLASVIRVLVLEFFWLPIEAREEQLLAIAENATAGKSATLE